MIEMHATDALRGVQEIRAILARIPDALNTAAEDTAKTIHQLALGRTPVGDEATDPHSGQAKRGWSDVQRQGMSGGFAFENPIDYTTILEEGGYKNVGPRTVSEGGKIYSRQAPGGILKPLVDDPQVLDDIADLVAEKLIEAMRAT